MPKCWQKRKVGNTMRSDYVECKNVVNSLQFFTPGCGLIEVRFDKNSNPSVKGLDGAPYWCGIPDEKDFLSEIRELYPHGFHSRDDVVIDWLRERTAELAKAGGVQITALEEYGCIMVDGINYDAYKVEVDHEYIKSPIYIAMLFAWNEFLVFRPYIRIEEFGDVENIKIFGSETEPTRVEPGEVLYFQDEIVSCKKYVYEYKSDKLKSESYGFKNNVHGFMYDTRFGKFMSSGGTTYLK